MFHRIFPKNNNKKVVLNTLSHPIPGFLVSAFLLLLPAIGCAEESYLDAIQLEAEKLGDTPAREDQAGTRPVAATEESVAEFEQELEARYRGTYLFYRKLPVRSQEEVFLEYQQGASIEAVRNTIMNRYLHSH